MKRLWYILRGGDDIFRLGYDKRGGFVPLMARSNSAWGIIVVLLTPLLVAISILDDLVSAIRALFKRINDDD